MSSFGRHIIAPIPPPFPIPPPPPFLSSTKLWVNKQVENVFVTDIHVRIF